jgi:TPR repeat protein
MKLGRLKALHLAEKKNNIASPVLQPTAAAFKATTLLHSGEVDDASTAKVDPLAATRRASEDPLDPRHAMACADLGAAYAVGAYGVEKDEIRAEHFLRLGVQGGDLSAGRNLGLLLLDLGR